MTYIVDSFKRKEDKEYKEYFFGVAAPENVFVDKDKNITLADKLKELDEKSALPTEHADPDDIYGPASETEYGHIKTSNDTTTPINSDAVTLTQKAAVNALNGKASTNHASNTTTYGIGTTAIYGHVKINNTYQNFQTASYGDGVAPSMDAFKNGMKKTFSVSVDSTNKTLILSANS